MKGVVVYGLPNHGKVLMKRPLWMLAVSALMCSANPALGEVRIDPWLGPGMSNLGNIASDGLGGRQILVRPLVADDIINAFKFFPPHYYLPEAYPEPTPDTPAQASVFLTDAAPLVLVIPQLQHYPTGAEVAVAHSLSGQEFVVDASIHFLGYATDTIYGPHEYVYPLGLLDAGQYRLTFNFSASFWYEGISGNEASTSGYIDFVVHAVPEPTPGMLFVLAAFFGSPILFGRSRGLVR